MIELHTWSTSNGHKILLFLEEAALPYRVVPVNIGKGDQFKQDFLRISPNNKIPAIVDFSPNGGGEPISIFESGAILLYLADKTGQFVSQDPRRRAEVMQWLFWQVAGLGPMAGQAHFFRLFAAERIPFAIDRYVNETNRLYGVLNRQLEGRAFVVGDTYSIADMAIYPWIRRHEAQDQKLEDFPQVARWFEAISARPATARAFTVGDGIRPNTEPQINDDVRNVLYGQTAASVEAARKARAV